MWSALAALAAFAPVHPPTPASGGGHSSAYVKYKDVKGMVVAVSDQGFTLRLTTQTMTAVGQGRNRRIVAVPRQADLEVRFADDGLVRWAHVDDAGPDAATVAGRVRLKLPDGAPGWAAERSALNAGQAVEVHFVRPKDIPFSRVTPDDVRVRYAVILRDGPPAPKR